MARSSRSFRSRGISDTQRRKKAWIDMNVQAANGIDQSGGGFRPSDIIGAGDSTAILQFPSQPGFIESTILRIRGTLNVPKSSYSNTAAMNTINCFGIGVVSDQAASAGAVPNPATATGYDWDGWLFLRQASSEPLEPNSEIVDVKAMRKWQSGDSIIFVAGFSTSDPGGATAVITTFSLRGLFLLP